MKKALLLGILSSMFFAFTFILNRSMNLGGGYWLWNGPLRYLITLPLMGLVLVCKALITNDKKKGIVPVLTAIKSDPFIWIVWSSVGFGLFYLPLTLASVYGESWMIASSWELTIVAGVLLTPLFGKRIPVKNLLLSGLIVVGVFIMQIPNISTNNIANNLFSLIPIIIGAFAYPLGNRMMMKYCPDNLDTMQRIFGMLVGATPFWIIVMLAAFMNGGVPSTGQVIQSVGVAVFSGIIATSFFFRATDIVKNNPRQLAVIEATQCGEVVFTLIGGIIFLHDSVPTVWGFTGIFLIITGMIMNSLCSS